jgi:hypothetical protein
MARTLYANKATSPAKTPAAPRTSSLPSRFWPLAVFVVPAVGVEVLVSPACLLVVLVTNPPVPVIDDNPVVIPTESTEAVGIELPDAGIGTTVCVITMVTEAEIELAEVALLSLNDTDTDPSLFPFALANNV